MPPRNLLVIFLTALLSVACYQKAQRNRYAAIVAEGMQIIGHNYVKPVDERQLFENAMTGMASGLDPYSSYISPDDFREFEESLEQEFGGVGMVVEYDEETRQLLVLSPLVGTPAFEAGVRAGDVILKIDDTATGDLTLKRAVAVIRGRPGTQVRVTVRHAGSDEPEEVVLKRAIIPVRSILGDARHDDGSWQFYLEAAPRIGYIRITSFGEQTVEDLKRALTTLDPRLLDGLVLDLRNNAGGLLTAAVSTCDLFLDAGLIVSTRGRDAEVRDEYRASPEIAFPQDVPMVLLINNYSASASEIVAACLQDHHRAVIVGERSWGKGTVQNVIRLENGRSALKLTTATYWRPSGRNIHRDQDATEQDDWGVKPDEGMEVELTEEQFEKVVMARRQRDVVVGKGQAHPSDPQESQLDDPQLQRAVDYLKQLAAEAEPRIQRT